MSETQACASAARTHRHKCTHMQPCISCSGRKWAERERRWGKTQSPPPTLCYTSPSTTHIASVRPPLPLRRSGCVQAGGVPYHIHCTHSRGLEVCVCVCTYREGSQQLYNVMLGTILSVTVWLAHSNEMKNERTCFHRRIHYFVGERNKRRLLWQDDWQPPQMYF